MAKRWDEVRCSVHPDKSGVLWDLVLYVPTVGFLLLWGLKLWFGSEDQHLIGYALMFLGFFFLMVGGGRVLRRLLILPSSPVSLDINADRIKLALKSGDFVSLVKGVRFYSDYAGKSFGLSGMDAQGTTRQFVFHRKQFDAEIYGDLLKALDKYK